MKKPTPDELVKRVESLEAALDTMLGALKADMAALRADLKRLSASEPPARAGSGSFTASANPTRKVSSPSHSFSEVAAPPQKKDPRSDE